MGWMQSGDRKSWSSVWLVCLCKENTWSTLKSVFPPHSGQRQALEFYKSSRCPQLEAWLPIASIILPSLSLLDISSGVEKVAVHTDLPYLDQNFRNCVCIFSDKRFNGSQSFSCGRSVLRGRTSLWAASLYLPNDCSGIPRSGPFSCWLPYTWLALTDHFTLDFFGRPHTFNF